MSENVQAVEEKRGLSQHWPVALLALAVVFPVKPLMDGFAFRLGND